MPPLLSPEMLPSPGHTGQTGRTGGHAWQAWGISRAIILQTAVSGGISCLLFRVEGPKLAAMMRSSQGG